ncbi:hypothetical protein E2C01_073101 [Portunus trituberculatus]|uniref:Uncharacterized protein n=1 Tax=Portunus trituberculatus TaxID=210409 RepID=A0A5B7ICG4_PORTR|nr:hypothetical protein [Portunus trituberculatus]
MFPSPRSPCSGDTAQHHSTILAHYSPVTTRQVPSYPTTPSPPLSRLHCLPSSAMVIHACCGAIHASAPFCFNVWLVIAP